MWLTIDPPRCRAQVALHAAHQFKDASVNRWGIRCRRWSHVTRRSDDLFWLAFVTRELAGLIHGYHLGE